MMLSSVKLLMIALVVSLVLYVLVMTYEILDMVALSNFLTLLGLVTLIITAFILVRPKRRVG